MPRPRPVVLLIDSDETVRVTHETILRTEGYEIVSAADSGRALALVRESPPALILVAARIGQLSTPNFIRMIKTDASLNAVKVAACIPRTLGSFADDCADAGADRILEMPIAAQELVREVTGMIGRA